MRQEGSFPLGLAAVLIGIWYGAWRLMQGWMHFIRPMFDPGDSIADVVFIIAVGIVPIYLVAFGTSKAMMDFTARRGRWSNRRSEREIQDPLDLEVHG